MSGALPLHQQVAVLIEALKKQESGSSSRNAATFAQMVKWLQDLPPKLRTEALLTEFRRVYSLGKEELHAALTSGKPQLEFDLLVPNKGWLRDYIEYTINTEPPTVFHYFAGLTAIGAALARNVWHDRGYAHLVPNLCTIIVAPSGKCRKTSACNLSIGLLRDVEAAPILADAVTPEAIVTSFEGQDNATGLIYAPELAVFLGRQEYNRSMVPLLTRLLESPTSYKHKTVGRGEITLFNVAISFLGCSTMDWIQKALPKDAFGGGFMSRFLFVVQEDTPRRFAAPPPPDKELRKKLLQYILKVKREYKGEIKFSEDGWKWFDYWYNTRKDTHTEIKQFSGYYERKPDHVIRLAMLLLVCYGYKEMFLTPELLKEALAVLDWLETQLPDAFEALQENQIGEEQMRVLEMIKKNGGVIEWPDLVKRTVRWSNAQRLKGIVDSMREADMVKRDGSTIFVTSGGWK
jgi:hypothetical protein